jgi:hypothetical protein
LLNGFQYSVWSPRREDVFATDLHGVLKRVMNMQNVRLLYKFPLIADLRLCFFVQKNNDEQENNDEVEDLNLLLKVRGMLFFFFF